MTTDYRTRHRRRISGSLAYRVRSDRRIAGLAAAGLLGALLAPTLAANPAAAAPCQAKDFAAAAAADLVKAKLLDLGPLGADAPALAGVTVSSARSWVDSTAATKSRAAADYLDAEVLGRALPAGPLDAAVSQSAPPDNRRPAVVRPMQLDADLLRVGTGPLSAHATWKPEYGCRTAQGVIAEAFGSDLDAAMLPAMTTKGGSAEASQLGEGLVTLPSNAFSRTATGLTRRNGTMTTAATAWTGLSELVLLGDTRHQTTVRVIHPPELTAYATGSKRTSAVEYRSPVLEIVTSDGTSHRLDAPGEDFTLTIPPQGPPTVAGDESAPKRDSARPESPAPPVLPEGVLPGGDRPGSEDRSRNGDPEAEGSKSATPDRGTVAGLLEGLTGGSRDERPGTGAPGDDTGKKPTEDAPAAGEDERREYGPKSDSQPELTVRLSLGHLDSRIGGRSVRAEAASLRLQLLAARGDHTATLADVGLGVLKVRATAPGAPHQPPASTPPAPGGGGSLPTTGFDLMAVLATGALLLVAGRFLMVVARQRTTSDTPQG